MSSEGYCFTATYEPYNPMDPIKEVENKIPGTIPCPQCNKLWSYSILQWGSTNNRNVNECVVVKCTGCGYSIEKLRNFEYNESDPAHKITQEIFRHLKGKCHTFSEVKPDTEMRLCICKRCEIAMYECFRAADEIELEEYRNDPNTTEEDMDFYIHEIEDNTLILMDNLRGFYLTMLINM